MRPVLTGPIRPAEWLGASASALYLMTQCGTVLAILTHEAVRLPCAAVLAHTAAELPLTDLAPEPARRLGSASVGAGRVRWTGRTGLVTIACAREWAPSVVTVGPALPSMVDALSVAVAKHDVGIEADRLARLTGAGEDPTTQFAAVAGLLGRGPGLTPSGDDVVAGFLLGARAFGQRVPGATAAVHELAGRATTALSAQLLRHASRGECVAQVATVVAGLTGGRAPDDAVDQLLAVGQTSGAALGAGLLSAAARSDSAPAWGVG
jgi:hypothetical protein